MKTTTEKQETRVCKIRDFVARKTAAGVATQEIKKESLTPLGNGTIDYTVTAGLPNDEGTMAQVFCRETYQVFITPRGGIKVHWFGYGKRTGKHLTIIARCMRG